MFFFCSNLDTRRVLWAGVRPPQRESLRRRSPLIETSLLERRPQKIRFFDFLRKLGSTEGPIWEPIRSRTGSPCMPTGPYLVRTEPRPVRTSWAPSRHHFRPFRTIFVQNLGFQGLPGSQGSKIPQKKQKNHLSSDGWSFAHNI